MSQPTRTQASIANTEIVVLLDKSGSMSTIASATVNGFNKFVYEQQQLHAEASLSLIQFNGTSHTIFSQLPIKSVYPISLGKGFSPDGNTAMLDAIGHAIKNTEVKGEVIFIIITDGYENASTAFSLDTIKGMITALQQQAHWKFIFMGANQDAIAVGKSLGIDPEYCLTYLASDAHVTETFEYVSSNVHHYRQMKHTYHDKLVSNSLSAEEAEMMKSQLRFKDEQRHTQK
jgi:uncharacterized protein YegL